MATVINYHEGYYQVFVVVYEPSQNQGKIKEMLETFEISNGYNKDSLDSAKSRARELGVELDGENPILYIHPSASSYTSFSNITKEPYIIRVDLPREWITKKEFVPFPSISDYRHSDYRMIEVSSSVPNQNPKDYLKPLDVVWEKKAAFPGVHFYHVGIYLGNGEVCHISGDWINKKGIRNCSWETFVEGCVDGEVFGYHSIIPFKNYETITRQISWTINNQWRENDYCLAGQNCEHAANMLKYGIEYSRQAAERPNLTEFPPGVRYAANKNKSGSFVLKDEIKRVNNRLEQSNDSQAQIEILPKQECRMM